MKFECLSEPELEFGGSGRHIDIRFGLTDYGPHDVTSERAPRRISVGVVGTSETVEKFTAWLERCRGVIPAKKSRQPNLFPAFPGFAETVGFRSTVVMDETRNRTVSARRLDELIVGSRDHDEAVANAATVFEDLCVSLLESATVDVLLCAVPRSVEALRDRDAKAQHLSLLDFHDYLKARLMRVTAAPPLQLILPQTYDATMLRQQTIRAARKRMLQDEATRAWNLHTAIYYKAGGLPWRLVRQSHQLQTCFIGISFYRSLDQKTLHTSMAQVFDERGDGIIVRGGPVRVSKTDRVPRLDGAGMTQLLLQALDRYRRVHHHDPARVVLHKTSQFSDEEVAGARTALAQHNVALMDAISITKNASARAFRVGAYPPLRGTLVELDSKMHLLYLKGSVDFYQTYPGQYVPKPFLFRCDSTESSPRELAKEILSLSKMNWNNTQFDGGSPITETAARRVGNILRHVDDRDDPASRYSHYM